MRVLLSILSFLMIYLSTAAASWGDIIMNIDSVNQQFWFTGSATGSPGDNLGIKEVSWSTNSLNPGTVFSDVFNPDFSWSGNVPVFESYVLHMSTGGGNKLSLTARFDTFASTTLTAGGTKFSYGAFNAANRSFLDGLGQNGGAIPIDFGVGFNAIQVNGITAVPEPSSLLLASIVGLGLFSRRRAKK
jgi:hypothetical protein